MFAYRRFTIWRITTFLYHVYNFDGGFLFETDSMEDAMNRIDQIHTTIANLKD